MTVTTDNRNSLDLKKLFETVVDGDYCVGCGACAAVKGSPVKMKLDQYGKFRVTASLENQIAPFDVSVQEVCPFSEESLNENHLGKELYAQNCQYDNNIGYYLSLYAGFASKGNFRQQGSSGGMGTWIISTLLQEDLVDGIIHIHQRQPSADDPRLFHYQISTTVEQVKRAAKSRYYPIELSEVIQLVREKPARYAIVGIPCFIKAVRLLMRQDTVIAERIKFCIGLVCGHLKSIQFAQMLAWQCGIEPKQLQEIDFRKKLSETNANQYGIEVKAFQNGQKITCDSPPVHEMHGTDWGLGYFKYKACDYCDDVVAETADITIGDAWLPRYIKDSQGTNIVVVRHPLLKSLLEKARDSGDLTLDNLSPQEIIRSQDANYRHRRKGLAYRLYLAQKRGEWFPSKRVKPSMLISPRIKKRQMLRILLAEKSHTAFKEAIEMGQFSVFIEKMNPLVTRYRQTYQYPWWRKTIGNLKRFFIR